MKKGFVVTLAFTMCLSLIGCGEKGTYDTGSVDEVKQNADEITIFVLEKNSALKQIASAYEMKNEGVKITFDDGKNQNSDLTQTEILKNLNTSMLNGDGPDLICFDGFSSDGYEDMLVDLSGIVQAHKEDCYENILGAYEKNDTILQIPLRFSLTGTYTKSDLAVDQNGTTAGEMLKASVSVSELGTLLEENDLKLPAGSNTAMITLWCRVYAEKINSGDMDEKSIEEFYEFLDEIVKKCGSKNLSAAMDFLNYACTDEAQENSDSFSWSVNRNVMEENISNPKISTTMYTDSSGKDLGGDMITPTEAQVKSVTDLIEEVNTPICNYELFVDFILEPYQDYLLGKMTRTEAVAAAGQKISIYRMENGQ
ncbi:extracellular solute-binding protein [uncultured Eubacterium sp.]|uniref:extracellular solute-binding protein n=1 Tax=uncultured Eubacterium sp. TaxID=165185 RepID=UPI0025E45BB2|nr:extracellular solute-binding protein [uncultured Eubacterium sp.]